MYQVTQLMLGFLLVGVACTKPAPEANSPTRDVNVSWDRELILLPVSLEVGLQLATGLEDSSISISACSSGFTAQLSHTSPSVSLYEYDTQCVAKLDSFTLNGISYSPDGPFQPSLGSTTVFKSDSGEQAMVEVTAQISSPVAAGNSIGFSIVRNVKSSDKAVDTKANIVIIEALKPSVDENEGIVSFIVKKVTEADNKALKVNLSVSGTAVVDEDYISPSLAVTIPAGKTEVTFDIILINDDMAENAEIIEVSAIENKKYFSYGTAQSLIYDYDSELPASGQVVRMDQSSVLTSGSSVVAWNDLSGQGNHGSQSGSARPTLVEGIMNGQQGVLFDGNDDVLKIADAPELNTGGPYSEKTLILSLKTSTDITRRQLIYEQGGATRGLSVYLEGGQIYCNGWNNNNDDGGLTTPWSGKYVAYNINVNTTYIVALRMDHNRDTLECFVNGAFVGSVSGIGKLFSHSDDIGLGGPNGGTLFPDGSSSTSGTYFSGYIGDFIAYNTGLGESEFLGILNYLNTKYGYTTPNVTLSIDPIVIDENKGVNPTLAVVRSNLGSQDLVVRYQLGGTATETLDYQMTQGQIVIPAFSFSASETIVINDDALVEGWESITVTLRPSIEFISASSTMQIDIADDESFNPKGDVNLWLDAASGVILNGSGVETWNDIASRQTITQSNTSRQPQLVPGGLNGYSAVQFDGSDDSLNVTNEASLNVGGPYTGKSFAFVLTSSDDVSNLQMIYEQGGNVRGICFYIQSGFLYFNAFNLANDDGGTTTPWGSTYVSIPITANTSYLVIGIWDYNNNLMTLNVGTQQTSSVGIGMLFNHSGAIGIGAVNSNIVTHSGATLGTGYNFKGSLYELLFYNEAIDAFELSNLQQHFNEKYGL